MCRSEDPIDAQIAATRFAVDRVDDFHDSIGQHDRLNCPLSKSNDEHDDLDVDQLAGKNEDAAATTPNFGIARRPSPTVADRC